MKIILASKSPARKKLLSTLLPKLALGGIKGFEVMPAEIDEDKIREKSPAATVKRIALLKAKKIYHELKKCLRCSAAAYYLRNYGKPEELTEETVIISADTMVYRCGLYIGKPEDKNEAKQILSKLSGTIHWLYSGICVLHVFPSVIANPDVTSGCGNLVKLRLLRRPPDGGLPRNDNIRVYLDFERTKVTFRNLSAQEIEEYVTSNDVHLWAGAYTIEKGTPGASFIKKIKGSSSNVLGLPVKKLKKILNDIGIL